MKTTKLVLMGIAVLALVSPAVMPLKAATVTPETLKRWDEYVQWSKINLLNQATHPDCFLSVDDKPRDLRKVQSGAILAVHDQPGGMVSVPYGLIHNWVGTVFIPGADLQTTLAVLQDYDGYVDTYSPGVENSKLLTHTPNDFTYELKLVQRGFGIKAGLTGEFRSRYVQLDDTTGYSITETLDLAELDRLDTPEERRLTLAESHGYVEKMFTVVRYRQRDGGVYVEVETMTLSRDIPAAIRWVVTPLVQKFSRELMTETLTRLRSKVLGITSLDAAKTKPFSGALPVREYSFSK